MRNYVRYTLLALAILFVFASIPTKALNLGSFIRNNIFTDGIDDTTSGGEPVSMQQLKAQVDFFKQALDEFGAISPMQAAQLWAKSRETRNGVYQYAVACPNLKQVIERKWGKADENFWIIGGSSPWVQKYEITHIKKINSNTYELTIKYYWATSAGDSDPSYDILTIGRENNYWCVQAVR